MNDGEIFLAVVGVIATAFVLCMAITAISDGYQRSLEFRSGKKDDGDEDANG